jgi:hypothetical protein
MDLLLIFIIETTATDITIFKQIFVIQKIVFRACFQVIKVFQLHCITVNIKNANLLLTSNHQIKFVLQYIYNFRSRKTFAKL